MEDIGDLVSLFDNLHILPSELISRVVYLLPDEYIGTMYKAIRDDRVKNYIVGMLEWKSRGISYWINAMEMDIVAWLIIRCDYKVYINDINESNAKDIMSYNPYILYDRHIIRMVNLLTLDQLARECNTGMPVSAILKCYSENDKHALSLENVKILSSKSDVSNDVDMVMNYDAVIPEDQESYFDWLYKIGDDDMKAEVKTSRCTIRSMGNQTNENHV